MHPGEGGSHWDGEESDTPSRGVQYWGAQSFLTEERVMKVLLFPYSKF